MAIRSGNSNRARRNRPAPSFQTSGFGRLNAPQICRPSKRDTRWKLAPLGETFQVQPRPIVSLKPYDRNPRIHSGKQISELANSIETFGFTNPVLIDAKNRIIAGHGRVKAARLLGLTTVPTIRLERMSEAQIRAYVLADNKLAEKAGWDRELLALELQGLAEFDINFDLTLTGFETGEIDVLLTSVTADPINSAADHLPELDDTAHPISHPGDLWHLGAHRLLCADATQSSSYTRLMGARRAQMVFADPPYNLPIDGHVSGLGRIKHTEFAMASGEMSEAEFSAFLRTIFTHLAHHSVDGALHYVFMDWRHLLEIVTAGQAVYAELKNLCVWVKDNAGMGSLYRSQHELVLVFKYGSAPHINNVELGRHGRYRTNIWQYAGVNTFRPGRLEDLRDHPTVKPAALFEDAIKDASKRGGIVLDPFAGSGTTLIAAERSGRRAYAMEIEPRYLDVAIRRWQDFTGGEAVEIGSGRTFRDLAAHRRKSPDGRGQSASCRRHHKVTARGDDAT